MYILLFIEVKILKLTEHLPPPSPTYVDYWTHNADQNLSKQFNMF
jgi:hypothetical protein